MKARVLAAVLACVACGDGGEDGKDGQDGQGVEITDLAPGSRECPFGGVLVSAGDMTRAVCAGAPGASGASGPAGAAGMDGADGDYQPELHISCQASFDLVDASKDVSSPDIIGSDGVEESRFTYDVLVFSNGDADVRCSVGLGSAQSATGGDYFTSVTTGAKTKACLARVDYPPFGSSPGVVGSMDFSISDQGPQVAYSDPNPASHPLDGQGVVFGEDDCFVRSWSGKTWSQIPLSAL